MAYHYEFCISKDNCHLIKNDGDYYIGVLLDAEIIGCIQKGYVNRFGGQEEPDSDDREVSLLRIDICLNELKDVAEQIGCDNVALLNDFIQNYDFGEVKEVKDYFFNQLN